MPQFVITTTVAAKPTCLVDHCTNYRTLTLIAARSLQGPTATPNKGMVRLGNSSTPNEQPIEMNPGDERRFDAAVNKMEDAQKWFFTVGTDGDGLVAIYS